MKLLGLAFLLLAGVSLSNECYSQLVADAGNDTAFCSSDWEEASFGGNPSALWGTEPYTYAWSAEYEYAGHTYTASFLLEDTTVANPVFTGPFNDSANFYLRVTDADQVIAIDSLMVRFSSFTACLGECREEIAIGDSIQLGHCVSGGISPLHFSWTPVESLSDPTSESPWAKPQISTTYEVVIFDSIGCQTTSSCKVLVLPVGIPPDNLNGDHLQIYPNPTSGIVNFSFTHPQSNNSVLKLFSAEGRLVKEYMVSEPVLTIDLTDLSHGLYIYNWIISDETIGSGKIVVQ